MSGWKIAGILGWVGTQLADGMRAFLVPATLACLPAGPRFALAWRAAAMGWMFPDSVRAAAGIAAGLGAHRPDLEREWRWTELIEFSDAWRLMFGGPVAHCMQGKWPASPGFVAAGMHAGSGITVLWSLRQAGLRPRFVLRRPERSALPGRPVLHAWYRLRFRLIRRLCDGQVITTGGAREALAAAIASGDATPVILFDTPAQPGRTHWHLDIGQRRITLPTGALEEVETSGVELVGFAPLLDREAGRLQIRVSPLDTGAGHRRAVREFMEGVLAIRPGQWLLWHAVEPYLEPRSEACSDPGPEPGAYPD